VPPAARVSAAGILLDRGWGRAPQPHAGEDGDAACNTLRARSPPTRQDRLSRAYREGRPEAIGSFSLAAHHLDRCLRIRALGVFSAIGSPEKASVHRFIGCEWVGRIAGVYETSVAAAA
jgi:hypothetical protein